jgi:hypothetical protein
VLRRKRTTSQEKAGDDQDEDREGAPHVSLRRHRERTRYRTRPAKTRKS